VNITKEIRELFAIPLIDKNRTFQTRRSRPLQMVAVTGRALLGVLPPTLRHLVLRVPAGAVSLRDGAYRRYEQHHYNVSASSMVPQVTRAHNDVLREV
jgi:hypothetical protein